jgi:CubicO group peptidase (beta-lactamase class C family)
MNLHTTGNLSRRSLLASACAAVPSIALLSRMARAADPAVAPAATAAPAAATTAPIDPAAFAEADKAIEAAIADKQCPGAVLCAGRQSGIVYLKAYGNRAIEPANVPMTDDTVFDLASLTKPTATATSVMVLLDRGKIAVTDRVAKYLPAFGANGKQDVTIEQLLLHRGGLVADNPMSDFLNVAPADAMKRTLENQLRYEPGTKVVYSDVGFIVLGELVRVVSGKPVNEFAREEVFKPLKMNETMYLPSDELKPRCAPTEQREGHWMIGEVHDPRAYCLGKVAGHAGLFGTARDLSRYCRMMLGKGELDGVRVLKESTIAEMTKARALPDGSGVRGYGFDIDTGYSSPRGDLFTKGKSFGHTGFTGTSYWMDPEHDAFVILLTNSVHPNGKGKVVPLRRKVGNAVASVLLPKELITPANPTPEKPPATGAGL